MKTTYAVILCVLLLLFSACATKVNDPADVAAIKKQFLAGIIANPATIESEANSEMKAMVFGDTAVVHGLWIEKSTTSGKDTSYRARFTEVYVKRDGGWQCVTQYAAKVQ